MPDQPAYDGLGDEALTRIATSLSDLYYTLYEERPLDPRASLTGNMLAFVFSDGLSVTDRWLLKSGRDDRLREFREHFFEVVSGELIALVSGLTGFRVNYSFYGFDPGTRTTHAIFVLDLDRADVDHEERKAVLNWSEQVRRNARRLSQEHREARAKHTGLREEWRRKREEMKDARAEGATEPRTP